MGQDPQPIGSFEEVRKETSSLVCSTLPLWLYCVSYTYTVLLTPCTVELSEHLSLFCVMRGLGHVRQQVPVQCSTNHTTQTYGQSPLCKGN